MKKGPIVSTTLIYKVVDSSAMLGMYVLNVLINYPEYTIVARLGFVDTLSFFNSFSNHHSERIIDREKQCSSFSKAYVCALLN